VRGHGQVVGLACQRGVDVLDVLLVDVIGIAADSGDVLPLSWIVDIRQARVVELQIAAAELIDAGQPRSAR
jgi:hypothetical protein